MTDSRSAKATGATPVDQLAGGPGVSQIDPADPAAPNYRLLAALRTPLSLREIMIEPVRTGYIGKDHEVDPSALPPSGASLYPEVEVTEVLVPSADGPVRCAVYRKAGAEPGRPLIVYAHGGGFMVGSSNDTDFLTRRLCWDNDAVVVSPNYRLAPEWPFPTGLDDVLAVWDWLGQHAADLGGDPTAMAVAGDSSGANFAAVLPLRAREKRMAAPRASVMLGPVCDFRFEEYESFRRQAPRGIVYDAAFAGFMRGAYVLPEQWDHPHVSPIRGDLAGFPPAFIAVGTHDPMIDSADAFGQALLDAGNPFVEVFVRDGMPHGFYFFPNMFQQEVEVYGAIRRFLSRHLIGDKG